MFKNIVLLLLSMLIGLGIIEGALRAFVPVRNVGPSLTVYDETFGKRLKASFRTIRIAPEFTMRFTTNSLGFRGAEFEAFPYRPILFLGDSFTLGYGVNDGQEFPALVEVELKRRFTDFDIPIVNAGLGDNGNGYGLKFLRVQGPQYDPRLIVLQLMDNDFEDNVKEQHFYISPDNELRELPVPPKSTARIVQEFLDFVPGLSYLYLAGYARQVLDVTSVPNAYSINSTSHLETARLGPDDNLTFKLVDESLRLSRDEHWPVLATTVGIKGERLAQLRRLFEEYHTPWISLPEKEDRPDFYFAVDGHWNAAGHAYTADVITRWLLDHEKIWKEPSS